MSWRADLSLLRAPGVGALFAGRTLNMLGMAFAPVALAFGILRLPGGNEELLSLVLAAEAIPLIIFLLIGGVVADRYPRHLVLVASQTMAFLAYGWLAWLVGTGQNHPVLLVLAATLSGIGGALGWPALTGLIPQIVPEGKLQQGNALLGFGASVARIVGVVAGGAVTATVGGGWALSISAIFYAVTAGLAFTMTPRHLANVGADPRPTGSSSRLGSVFGELAEGWREFVSREWLWVVVAQWSLLIMCFNAAQAVLGPIIAKDHLGGEGPWSWILAGQAVGEILGVLLAMRWKPKHPILVPVVATAATIWLPYALIASLAPVWVIVLSMVPMGAVFSLFGVLWNTTMQHEVPQEALSRVSSYDAMGTMMFGPVGLLLAGRAAVAFGARHSMVACSVLLFLTGIAALASRDVRRLTWRDDAVDGHALPSLPALPDDERPA